LLYGTAPIAGGANNYSLQFTGADTTYTANNDLAPGDAAEEFADRGDRAGSVFNELSQGLLMLL